GVRQVHGSIAGPCIELEHDTELDLIEATIRDRLHGVEMYANEIRMVPLDPVELTEPCAHHRLVAEEPAVAEPAVAPAMTLGEIVNRHPGLAVELERRGLDYCCHGGRTLAQAAVDA